MSSASSKLISILFLVLQFCSHCCSQEIGDSCTIRTGDGNLLQGILITKGINTISIDEFNLGTITVPADFVKKIEPLNKRAFKFGENLLHSAAASKYFVSPSSFGLKKGDAYFHTFFAFNQFAYGLTDKITFGVTVIPGYQFYENIKVGFSGKYSEIISQNIRWGLGIMIGNIFDDYSNESNGRILANTTATFGSKLNKLTLGYSLSKASFQILSVNFSLAISRKYSILCENSYFSTPKEMTTIITTRYVGKEYFIDFGVFIEGIKYDDNSKLNPIPMVSVTIPLSYKNSENFKSKDKR